MARSLAKERFRVRSRLMRIGWAFVVLLALGVRAESAGDMLDRNRRQAIDTTSSLVKWAEIDSQLRLQAASLRMCGPLAAARLLQKLGHPIDIKLWEQRCRSTQRSGVPLEAVVRWCCEADSTVKGAFYRKQNAVPILRSLLKPCILVVEEASHCVVLEELNQHPSAGQAEQAVIWDPAQQIQKRVDVAALAESWSGMVIGRLTPPWWSSWPIWTGASCLQLLLIWRLARR